MRRWILSGAVAVLALALAGVAFAQFTQVSKITLTAKRAGQSTGIRSNIVSSDPAAHQPKAVTKLVVQFPKGTTYNLATTARSACTVSDKELKDQFGTKCPSSSFLAAGKSALNAFPLPSGIEKTPNEIPATVKAYLGRANIIFVIRPTVTAYKSMITVLHATVSGSTMTVKVPKLMWGADKKTHFKGVQVVLDSFHLSVPAIGSGRTALVTAGRCTAGKFVVRSHFVYADGSKLTIASSSSCRK